MMETIDLISTSALTITTSFFAFRLINNTLNVYAPHSVKKTEILHWKWTNVFCSLIHAIISGVGSCFIFYACPELASDVMNTWSRPAHLLVSFSIGYFIHDSADMVMHNLKKSTFELLVHHGFVVCCFGVAVGSGYYVGYATVALIAEINSVFLHVRQVLAFQGVSKRSHLYRLNSLITIATFPLFRISTLGWMTRWLVLHRDVVPLATFTLGSIALATLVVMTTVLFFRVLQSDFVSARRPKAAAPGGASGGGGGSGLAGSLAHLLRSTEEEEVYVGTKGN